MNIASWLYQSARSWPERPAVYLGTKLFANYRELASRTASLAERLARNYGVTAGDRIAIFAANCPEYLEILHAAWWLGAAAVPINYKLHPKEASWIIDNAGARLAFTDTGMAISDLADCIEIGIGGQTYNDLVNPEQASVASPKAVSSDSLAWLFYTSGTTGRPKGVMLSHDNLIHMTLCYALDVSWVEPDDVSLYAAPISHGAGLYSLPFIRRAAAHLVPESRGFDPAEIIALARDPGRLNFFAAPTMVKRLVAEARKQGYDGEGLRTVVYGGGPMYEADINEALEVLGPKFVQIYGQGESPMTITALSRDVVADCSHPNWRHRRASVGVAQSCVEVAVLDPDLRPVPPGKTGEVAVRGPTVMLGYWQNEAATKETIRDGWLMTGDLGYLDEDNFLTLTDRCKDVIISGGTNIYPREVEEVLLRHPEVFEVAVVGAPDPEWGEVVVAFVVLCSGSACDAGQLEEWCKSQIASFKKPKRYHFVSELPRNSYGKILKKELRKQLAPGG